jgi:uncharacterized protein (UPF0262 family)
MEDGPPPPSPSRIIEVILDEDSIGRSSPEVDQERQVAIFDLLEGNFFELFQGPQGPYRLNIAMVEQRIAFAVTCVEKETEPCATFLLSMSPFRSVVKDYFLVCESYFDAIKSAPPSRIEALDMGRRALHDEGSKLLVERFEGKIRMDNPTSRRLFTLLCALHWKG